MYETIRRAVAALGAVTLLSACSGGSDAPASEAATDAADLIITNAYVHTVNDAQPSAEAIAVRGDEIVYVGDSAGAAAYAGDATETLDLGGKMLMPGFVDGHSHAVAGGLIMQGVDLQADTQEEVFAKIKAEVESHEGDIVLGYGVRFTPWGDGFPTAGDAR